MKERGAAVEWEDDNEEEEGVQSVTNFFAKKGDLPVAPQRHRFFGRAKLQVVRKL